MQLISLTANMDSFKPVYFKNQTGINLIVASQKYPGKSDKGDTTNGVGKSLLIAIIHFCLGSSQKNDFKKKLPGWIFTIKFKINQQEYIATRQTDLQNKIIFNNKEMSWKTYKQKLTDLLFILPEETKHLTFRSLVPFFIRPAKASYVSENNPNAINSIYQIQKTNAFLLGLDVSFSERKYQIKKEKDRIHKLVNDLKNDKYLKNFFTGDKDIHLAKDELEENIKKLESDLKSFKIADDYYDIKKQADELKQSIENIQDDIELLKIQIQNINESIKITPDIKREKIEDIYKEASVIIKKSALKKLSELEKFYTHLLTNREKRLVDQKYQLIKKRNDLQELVDKKIKELNEKLKYLNAHHALDIYTKLSNKLTDAKSKRENLIKYDALFSKYNEQERTLKKEQIIEAEKTDNYLKDAAIWISKTNNFFRMLVKRFYPEAAAGITIYNNEGDNQTRFDIDAKIEADKSDGIGNVKIFCYDLSLLIKGFGHKIDFIFHDSRLLDGIDPRQVHELFLILSEYIKSESKQYILSVNQNQLEEIKQYFDSASDYKKIIEDNIILNLKDNDPKEKLLGIQVDMDYD